MLIFIPYIIIILSLIGIIVLILKKMSILAKISNESSAAVSSAPFTEKTVNLIKEKIAHPNYWLAFLTWFEKSLRKTRIVFLKIDSFFVASIAKSRESSKNLAEKSKAWVSERRMKRIEKLKMLAEIRRTDQEKEDMLLSILRQNPRDIKAYKELGCLYLEKKNFQDAKSAFEEVLKINSEDELAKEKLKEINEAGNGGVADSTLRDKAGE
jgi:tetratricopeptide (TPR) repeat protein